MNGTREGILKELTAALKRIAAHPKTSVGHKLEVQVIEWEFVGLRIQSDFLQEVMTTRMRDAAEYSLPLGVRVVMAHDLVARGAEWV